MSNLSYSYVESGIVLNISSYADLKKLNVSPRYFAVFGEAFLFILDEIDANRLGVSAALGTLFGGAVGAGIGKYAIGSSYSKMLEKEVRFANLLPYTLKFSCLLLALVKSKVS